MSEGPPLAADAVLIALPAPAAAALLAELAPPLAGELRQISYASAVTVHLAWSRQAVERPPEGYGFFVPRTAGSPVVAATFVSVKHPERTPEDQFVVRVYLGGALHPEAIDWPDVELVEASERLLAPLLGLREPPLWSRVWRHPCSMPQRKVGHPALVARLRALLAAHPVSTSREVPWAPTVCPIRSLKARRRRSGCWGGVWRRWGLPRHSRGAAGVDSERCCFRQVSLWLW